MLYQKKVLLYGYFLLVCSWLSARSRNTSLLKKEEELILEIRIKSIKKKKSDTAVSTMGSNLRIFPEERLSLEQGEQLPSWASGDLFSCHSKKRAPQPGDPSASSLSWHIPCQSPLLSGVCLSPGSLELHQDSPDLQLKAEEWLWPTRTPLSESQGLVFWV